MTRKLSFVFAYAMLLSLNPIHGRSAPFRVVASASMIADMTHQIAGDLIEVQMIVPLGGDPHLYEPTPKDASLVNSADLILINGLTFEGWINELIENSGTKASTVTVTRGIETLSSETYTNSVDPHAWMSAANGQIYADNIHAALCQLDPSNTETYTKNLNIFKDRLEQLDTYIKMRIESIPAPQRVLITSHDAFQYYGKRYGIKLEAIMGISTEAEAQTSDVVRVTKSIRENKIPALFIESTINPKLMEQLAHDNHIAIGGKLYADSLGDSKSPAATYIDMLKYNTDTIVDALTGASVLSQPVESKRFSPAFVIIGLIAVGILGGVLFLMNK